MEDVLDVYIRAYDPKRPLLGMDETSKQQTREVRAPIPGRSKKATRYDSEYSRNGVSNLFMFCAPLEGWRQVKVTDRRTKRDWAYAMKDVADGHFANAEKIVMVLDNLNTHNPSSFYETFPPEEAKRLLDRFEFHYTPKHGSWLNIAEIELSVLSRQCLSRRIPDQATLRREVLAWQRKRNSKRAKIDWRFTTKDARIKLRKLYPSMDA